MSDDNNIKFFDNHNVYLYRQIIHNNDSLWEAADVYRADHDWHPQSTSGSFLYYLPHSLNGFNCSVIISARQ